MPTSYDESKAMIENLVEQCSKEEREAAVFDLLFALMGREPTKDQVDEVVEDCFA